MNFFAELKRRNVFRVGVAYTIGAWLIAQIADLLIDNIGAPDWVMKTLFVMMGIGFFFALFFAWAFEMTPEGVKREADVDRSQSITKTTGHNLDRSIILVLVLALAYFAWDKFTAEAPQTSVPQHVMAAAEQTIDKSIAVLPFVNMSADKDNEYFSDGLSEELLNLLAKVDGLKVAARTSSFKFRNSDADIAEIGKQLNVATVLEGSVRKSGNQARITAQLIKVDDGFHLWSETYDRDLDNIFEVQDEIARAIVDALKLPLLGHDAKPITAISTDNFAAYDLYLLGRHHAREYSEQGFERALEYYLAALEIDPSFAPAYSGVADSYIYLSDYGDLPQGEAQQMAREAAQKALAINPDSPEAHSSMGLLLNNQGHNREAETHFIKALEVNPNYVNALLWYCSNLDSQRRNQAAMELAERAMGLDPLSHSVRRTYVGQLINMLRFDDATTGIQAFIATNPDDPTPYELWGDLFQKKGLPQNTIPMFRNAHRLRPGDIYMAAQNVEASLELDDTNLAAYWLKQAQNRGAEGQWTRSAENVYLYANGNFAELLSQADQLLEQQPGQTALLIYRSIALAEMGQLDAARQSLQTALSASGYEHGQGLSGDQLQTATLLANVHDQLGDTSERDLLLTQITELAAQLRQSEPSDRNVALASAGVASINNDLPGMLSNLDTAIEQGFRSHWELIRNPIYQRWQDNAEFIAFYQGMLKAAESMRREYKINNPAERLDVAVEATN